MGLLMSGLGSIVFAIGVMIIMAIVTAFVVAIFIGIAALIVGGSTAAPALVFALLFTMGKSENLIISILIFAVSYYAIKKLIQYKKVENAIMVHLAVIASTLSTYSVKMAISFVFDRTPAWILLILIVGVMVFMISPVMTSDRQNKKEGYPIITRIVASILYGSAFISLLGALVIVFEINIPGYFTIILYVLWGLCSAAAYILDIKLSENEDFIKTIKELPIRKVLKEYYDKVAKVILNRIGKYMNT